MNFMSASDPDAEYAPEDYDMHDAYYWLPAGYYGDYDEQWSDDHYYDDTTAATDESDPTTQDQINAAPTPQPVPTEETNGDARGLRFGLSG